MDDDIELRRAFAEIDIIHLLDLQKVEPEEYTRLYEMIRSGDHENLTVAEEAIKQLAKQ